MEFLVHWDGYASDLDSWEPWRILRSVIALHTYLRHHGLHTHTHRVNTGNLASDPKNREVRRFVRPLLIIGLSWELIDEGLCSEESADLRSAISAWVRERSSWSSSLCFWISWMMTFILVSSMETIRGSAPMFRSLSAAVTLPRRPDILLFGIFVEFFLWREWTQWLQ